MGCEQLKQMLQTFAARTILQRLSQTPRWSAGVGRFKTGSRNRTVGVTLKFSGFCRQWMCRKPVFNGGASTWAGVSVATWVAMLANVDVGHADTLRVPQQHATIQGAIDHANPGDVVVVQEGTYQERLVLRNGVTVRSFGGNEPGKLGLRRAERTIIDGGQNPTDKPGVQMAEGSVLNGFTVTGVGNYDAAAWEKHYVTSGNEQEHESIGAPGVAGIAVNHVNCQVVQNIVHHVGYTGIAVQGESTSQVRVIGNVCYRNMGGGIGFMDQARGYVQGNRCFENFYAGIGHENASPSIIENRCWNNIRAGIGISEGACPIVMRNKCFENRRAGIGVRTGKATRPLIQDNDCYQNGMAGIGADEKSTPVIRGNRCYRNKMAGIGVRSEASAVIVGNECYENVMSGIGQEGNAVTTLIENHVHHNQLSGLGFNACQNGVCTAIGNRVLENRKVAVGVQTGWQVTLVSNRLERTGGMPPIVMVFEGATAVFRENIISGQGVAGVRVMGTVLLDGNRFVGKGLRRSGPPNFGVWALANATVTLRDNHFTDWRHAVHATQSNVKIENNVVSSFYRHAFHLQQLRPGSCVIGNQVNATDSEDSVLSGDVPGESGGTRVEANVLVPIQSK